MACGHPQLAGVSCIGAAERQTRLTPTGELQDSKGSPGWQRLHILLQGLHTGSGAPRGVRGNTRGQGLHTGSDPACAETTGSLPKYPPPYGSTSGGFTQRSGTLRTTRFHGRGCRVGPSALSLQPATATGSPAGCVFVLCVLVYSHRLSSSFRLLLLGLYSVVHLLLHALPRKAPLWLCLANMAEKRGGGILPQPGPWQPVGSASDGSCFGLGPEGSRGEPSACCSVTWETRKESEAVVGPEHHTSGSLSSLTLPSK